MPLNEFSLINNYFQRESRRDDVLLGIGDDAAILCMPDGHDLVAAIDTLVDGVHFPENSSPFDIGYKALAVNLSDLAAMGATPAWATLALTLPEADAEWLEQFANGFFAAAEEYNVALAGGDTTRGPLTISVQLQGFVPQGKAVRRSGAQVGDHILVSGMLGDAGLGLAYALGQREGQGEAVEQLLSRLHRPSARVALGIALRDYVHAMIDVSDGLWADLQHILEASRCGAQVNIDSLPRSQAFQQLVSPEDEAWNRLPLTAGDDFELLCCVPAEQVSSAMALAAKLDLPMTDIGVIEPGAELRCVDKAGKLYHSTQQGYQHFT